MRRNRVRVVPHNMFSEQEDQINLAYLNMVKTHFRSEFTKKSWFSEDKFIPPRIEFQHENRQVNAFAYENGDKKNRILLTGGTIAYFTQTELMCIIAHELSHNYHKDFRNRNIISTLLFVLSVSVTLILAFKFSLLFLTLFPLLLIGLKYWVAQKSQAFELRADQWMLKVDPAASVRVIEKLGQVSRPESPLMALFSTHPTCEKRLSALKSHIFELAIKNRILR